MSLDRSLRSTGSLTKHRNVLTRPERIAKLKESGRFEEGETDPVHLAKVANRKIFTGKKAEKKGPAEGEEAVEGAEAAAPAAEGASAAKPAAKPAGKSAGKPAK